MIALIVRLEVQPERLELFLTAIKENAERSFNDEAGCLYFDINQDTENPLLFNFYELYENEAAIDAHRAASHFAKWRAAAEQCIVPGSQVNLITKRLIHHS